ncbi:MAG: ComF family protein [Candidatus Taylorbacteria bacterium]|nr:ComF family protein [Candidatus Taylorbacteria bacterium]
MNIEKLPASCLFPSLEGRIEVRCATLMKTVHIVWNWLLDIVFPQKPLVRELERMDASEFSSQAEKTDGFAGKTIISLFSYRDSLVREAVWELKYRGNKKVAELLGTLMYDELLAFLEEYAPLTNFTDPLLIPIPLSKKRESERGFNQCRLLAEELLRLDFASSSPPQLRRGVESSRRGGGVDTVGLNFTLCLNGLRKIKDTPSQTKTDSKAERLYNLEGCFEADSAEVAGRNIILIDDVATTGATIEEAKRALKSAGAKKVIAFTVAH